MSCLDAVTETVADAAFIHLSSIFFSPLSKWIWPHCIDMHRVFDTRNSSTSDGSVCMNYNSFLIYKSLTFGSAFGSHARCRSNQLCRQSAPPNLQNSSSVPGPISAACPVRFAMDGYVDM